MGWRLVDESSEGIGRGEPTPGDRESLAEARRSIGDARRRLEELADHLRELGDRLGDDGAEPTELDLPSTPFDSQGS